MKKLFSYAVLAAGLISATAGTAAAGDLKLTISNGRVTLVADEVPVRQILAEWARVGQMKIINGEKMIGPPLTLELYDVPEAKALETVLRSAAGYVVAPRMNAGTGPSSFDSVVILATSRAPAVTPASPMPFTQTRPNAQPVMPPVDETDEDVEEPETAPPTGIGPIGRQFPGQPPRTPQLNGPQQAPQGPLTAPRPGQLQPAPGQINPYAPQTPTGMPTQPGQPGQPNVPGAVPVPRPGGGGGN